MPAGLDVTVPVPAPARVTASAKLPAGPLNVAVTARACVIDTVQVLVPVQAPLQPANVDPLAAAAVSVTEAPLVKFAPQVLPQLMPAGEDVTVPVPLPALVTVSAIPGIPAPSACDTAGKNRFAIFTKPEVSG